MKAYKLVRLGKDGQCYPLFINKHEPFVFGQQMIAGCYPTKGFAVREGFHCCFKPVAPHLKEQVLLLCYKPRKLQGLLKSPCASGKLSSEYKEVVLWMRCLSYR